jgi:hypothetical protein
MFVKATDGHTNILKAMHKALEVVFDKQALTQFCCGYI